MIIMSVFTSLIASILPYAIGAAVNPVLFTSMLDVFPPMKNPRFPVLSFFIGSIILFLLLIIFGLFLGSNATVTILRPLHTGALLEMFLGAILILIAFKTLLISEQARDDGFFGFIRGIRGDNRFSIFIKYLYFGMITILANLTTALLVFSGGTIIGLATPDLWTAVAVIIIFGLIALFLIEVPFVVYMTRPRLEGGTLESLNGWFTRHGDNLLALAMIILGIIFLVRGSLVFYG